MQLAEAMNKRRSIRSYTGEPIDDKQLEKILTAAYEAPIGMGKYNGIHLTIITRKDLLNEIDACAAQFFGNPSAHPLYGAPMLIVISSSAVSNVASADAGFILQNMSLAAVEEGAGQCVIYGAVGALNQNKELLEKLHLPDGFTPLGGIILGRSNDAYAQRTVPESHVYSMNRID